MSLRTAWVASTQRPGLDYSYTNNWPPEPLVLNRPTGSMVVWSVLSLILLLSAGLDAAGSLTLPIAIPNDPTLAGAAVALQSFALELGFESNIVASNGLRVVPGA